MADAETRDNKDHPEPEDKIAQTQHALTLPSGVIPYTATTGTIVLKEEEEEEGKAEGEKAKAEIFFIAYTRNDGEDVGERPLTFSFNGGPGSSSVWLHLGALGPRRVLTDDIGNLLPPPHRLVDNEYSLLEHSDLVFIDPVSTGYSRVAPGEESDLFHNFKKDIESVGDFIRLYTSRYGRWLSPKFLIGESYGTTRAGGLSGYLQERHGMYLNGIMLISAVLNFQTLRFMPGNDLPYALFLPTYAATAWYHRRLDDALQADLHQTLAEVKEFAMGEYMLALMQGDSLPGKRREEIATKLARYTGLTPDYVERTNLRINIYRFCKELLRQERRTVGRLDSRFTGIDRDAAGERVEYDPSYASIQGPYTAAFNDYVRGDLAFESDLPYEILTERVHPWRFAEHENKFVNVADTLRKAISLNPYLKVMVANGYYDLATPYLATEYTVDHLHLDPDLRDNLTMHYYEAGHMMYVHRPSLVQLRDDLAAFIDEATPA